MWQELQDKVRPYVARLRAWAARNPRRTAQWGLFGLVAFAFAIIMAWYPFTGWKTYDMLPLGLSLDLPSKPKPVMPTEDIPVPVAVFESRTEEFAIVLAAFESVTGEANAAQHVAKRAMDYLSHRPDLTNVKYQMTIRPFKGRFACHVSGTFQRAGAECRAVGTFVVLDGRIAQVLCLFSDLDGARVMERVMESVDLL